LFHLANVPNDQVPGFAMRYAVEHASKTGASTTEPTGQSVGSPSPEGSDSADSD